MEDNKKNKSEKELSLSDAREIKFISFEDLRYYPKVSKISRKKKLSALTAKPAQILNFLIINQHKAITRQDIIANVWEEKGCTDENFHKTIGVLRKELGDSQKPWRYITNPTKNHYALAPKAKVHYVFCRNKFWQLTRSLAAFLVVGVMVATAILRIQTADKVAGYKAVDFELLTDLEGEVERAVVSPDKSILVFMHRLNHQLGWGLRALRIGTEESKILVNSNDSQGYHTEPSFSPSGRQIAWVKTDYRSYCEIMIADFHSASLSLSNSRSISGCVNRWARTPQWRTESSLMVAMSEKVNSTKEITEIDLLTNERNVITSPGRSDHGNYGIFFNLANNKLAYLRSSMVDSGSELRIFDFSNNSDSLLKLYSYQPYSAAWLNSESILIKGKRKFEVINLEGKTSQVYFDKAHQQSFPFSIDNNRVGYVRGRLVDNDIFIVNLTNGKIDNSLSLPTHDYRAVIAKYTGDIGYMSLHDGKRQLLLRKGSISSKVLGFDEYAGVEDIAIAVDGTLLAFNKNAQLNIVDSSGDLKFSRSMIVKGFSFSHDNKALFVGVKENDKLKVKKIDLADPTKETILTDGFMPKATENGDVYFFRQKENKNYLYQISSDGIIDELFETPMSFVNLNSNSFDVINNRLFYVEGNGESKMLVSKDLSS
ncbi:winged helix-turn-helix domain-containing protein, partial [Aliikangiella coralliicola]